MAVQPSGDINKSLRLRASERPATHRRELVEPLELRRLLDASPVLVADLNTYTASAMPHSFTRVGDLGYFFASDPAHGSELWKTDGTPAGTGFVKDIRPGP